jgi:autotransporter translocation and assembly factor TamB
MTFRVARLFRFLGSRSIEPALARFSARVICRRGVSMTSPGRTRARRLLRTGAIILASFALVLVLLYAFRGPLFGRTAAQRLGKLLSEQLGARVTIDSVGGGVFNDLSLDGVRAVAPEGSSLAKLEIGRVRVTYPFLAILRADPLRRVETVEVSALDLEVDLTKEAAPAERPALRLPAAMPEISAEGRVAIRTAEGTFRSGRVELTGSGRAFRLLLDPLELPAAWSQPPARIEARLERSDAGTFTWSASGVAGEVELRSLRLANAPDGAVELVYEIGIAGGTAKGIATDAAIAFEIAGVDLGRLPAWIRDAPNDPDTIPAAGALSATGTLRSWRSAGRRLNAEVSARALTWAGASAEVLTASGEWTGDRIELASARAEVSGGSLSADGLGLSLSDPLVVVAARAVRAEAPDAARFLSALGWAEAARSVPPGTSFSLEADRPEGAAIRVGKLAVEDAGAAIEASGSVQPGPRWSGWRQFPLTVSVRGRSKGPQAAKVADRVDARLDELALSAEVRGTLGRPSGSYEIAAKGVRIGGERLDRASAQGTVEWPLVAFRRLEASSADGTLEAAGTLDLEKEELRDTTFAADLAAGAVERLFPELRGLTGRLRLAGKVARATPEQAEISATLAGSLGEAEASGTIGLRAAAGFAFDLRFEARVPDLARLEPVARGPWRVKGAARAEGRVAKAGAAAPASGTGRIEAAGLEVDGWKVGTATSAARLEGTVLELTSLAVDGPAGRASGEARIDVATGEVARAALDVDARIEAAAVADEAGARVRGPVQVKGRLEKRAGSDWTAFLGDVRLSADALEVEGQAIRDFDAHVVSTGSTIRVEHLRGRHAGASFEARGAVVPEPGGGRVTVEALATTLDGGTGLTLARPSALRWTRDSLVVEDFELAGLEGRIAGRASLGERVEIEIEARALELAALVPGVKGRVDGQLSVGGSPESPAITGRIHAPALAWGDRRVSIGASLRQSEGVLHVEDLDLDAGELLRLRGRGRLPAVSWVGARPRFGPMDDAEFTMTGTSSGAATWLDLGVKKPSRFSDLELEVEAQGRELRVRAKSDLLVRRARDEHEEKEVPVSADGRFSPDGARLEFRAGTAEEPLATAILQSSLPYDWTDLSRFRQGRAVEVDGRLDVEATDAGAFAPFLPELRALDGRAKLQAKVRGTLERPEFSGTAELDGVALRFEADVPGVDDLVARLRLEGREVVIDRLEGKSGYSPFAISGSARFETLRRPVLDVAVDGKNLLVARDDDLRLRADLNTTIRGPLEALKVGGKARVTDALWSQAMDLTGGTAGPPPGGERADSLFRFRSPPFSTATFDLAVEADKVIRVDNNLVRADLSARLSLVGSGDAPRLEGRIFTERAFVRLPFTRLDVERAEIQFRPQDDYRARLEAVAWTRLKGYELTVHVSGVLPDTNVKVSSLPPLTHRDAYLLLTTGITPAELEREGITRAALHRAGSVYGTELLSQFQGARDQNPLERFSLEIGRDESERGTPTIDLEAPLSQRFFLHVERDRFDDYNAGILWRLRIR